MDKLLTYFDDYDSNISNGLLVANQKEADTFMVKVRQERLNHKPFTVHIGINSDKATKVALKLFLGPKYDGAWNLLDFSKSYKYFYELDSWITDREFLWDFVETKIPRVLKFCQKSINFFRSDRRGQQDRAKQQRFLLRNSRRRAQRYLLQKDRELDRKWREFRVRGARLWLPKTFASPEGTKSRSSSPIVRLREPRRRRTDSLLITNLGQLSLQQKTIWFPSRQADRVFQLYWSQRLLQGCHYLPQIRLWRERDCLRKPIFTLLKSFTNATSITQQLVKWEFHVQYIVNETIKHPNNFPNFFSLFRSNKSIIIMIINIT